MFKTSICFNSNSFTIKQHPKQMNMNLPISGSMTFNWFNFHTNYFASFISNIPSNLSVPSHMFIRMVKIVFLTSPHLILVLASLTTIWRRRWWSLLISTSLVIFMAWMMLIELSIRPFFRVIWSSAFLKIIHLLVLKIQSLIVLVHRTLLFKWGFLKVHSFWFFCKYIAISCLNLG